MLMSIFRPSGPLYDAREFDTKTGIYPFKETVVLSLYKNTQKIYRRLNIMSYDYDGYGHCPP